MGASHCFALIIGYFTVVPGPKNLGGNYYVSCAMLMFEYIIASISVTDLLCLCCALTKFPSKSSFQIIYCFIHIHDAEKIPIHLFKSLQYTST